LSSSYRQKGAKIKQFPEAQGRGQGLNEKLPVSSEGAAGSPPEGKRGVEPRGLGGRKEDKKKILPGLSQARATKRDKLARRKIRLAQRNRWKKASFKILPIQS